MRHLKAVMLAFPELLSRCPTSVQLAILLKATRLDNNPWIEMEWPDGDWEAHVYSLNQACEAYYRPVLERSPFYRLSEQIQRLFGRNQQQDPDAYADEDEAVVVAYTAMANRRFNLRSESSFWGGGGRKRNSRF
jgi:hypothetical protein